MARYVFLYVHRGKGKRGYRETSYESISVVQKCII